MAIYHRFEGVFLEKIIGVSYIGKPKNNTMMYMTKKIEKEIIHLTDIHDSLIFVEDTVAIPVEIENNNLFVVCNDPASSYAEVALSLASIIENKNRTKKYTLTSEGYYIGEDTVIGFNTIIEPGSFIDHSVHIGNNVYIKTGARIRRNTVIGNDCVIGENTVIGEPAFNVAKLEDGRVVLIPSFGGVVIGNNVAIGANVSISKGGADNTILSDNVKIDSNVRIAHDVQLHNGVEVCGRSGVAGYSEIGEYTYISSGCSVKNRIKIGNHCFIGMASFVQHDIKDDNITVTGNPARSLEYVAKKRIADAKLRMLLRKNE